MSASNDPHYKRAPGAVGIDEFEGYCRVALYEDPDMDTPIASILLDVEDGYNLAQRITMQCIKIEDGKK